MPRSRFPCLFRSLLITLAVAFILEREPGICQLGYYANAMDTVTYDTPREHKSNPEFTCVVTEDWLFFPRKIKGYGSPDSIKINIQLRIPESTIGETGC
jgi:hypothetical protein